MNTTCAFICVCVCVYSLAFAWSFLSTTSTFSNNNSKDDNWRKTKFHHIVFAERSDISWKCQSWAPDSTWNFRFKYLFGVGFFFCSFLFVSFHSTFFLTFKGWRILVFENFSYKTRDKINGRKEMKRKETTDDVCCVTVDPLEEKLSRSSCSSFLTNRIERIKWW